jgi:uncharacterized tellurite resistance protein B-like protein
MTKEIHGSRLDGSTLVVATPDGETRYDCRFLVAALLIYVARGSGSIAPEESGKMIELIEEHFHMEGSESLELLTFAMSELADNPSLGSLLAELGPKLSESEKESIALMGLKVVAADGTRQYSELEQFNRAMEAVGVSPEIVHRAFDRYFAETMPGGR